MHREINILGGGLVGSLLSIMLAKKGFEVGIYEKRNDPRKKLIDQKRSINLALSRRGIKALQAAGIFDEVKPLLIPMHGRMVHDLSGNTKAYSYGREDQYINSVARATLNKMLIQSAEDAGATFNFNKTSTGVDLERNIVTFDETTETASSDILLGADGAFSSLRKAMQMHSDFFFAQSTLKHGYKELNIAPKDGDFAMEPNYLHIWPRKSFMLIALPNPDKSFTCTLFLPFKGERSFENLINPEAIKEFFTEEFSDAALLMQDLVEQFNTNPTSSLVTIKTSPWTKNRAMLIGDASHAIVPFYGQGMNAGFEDCRLFMEYGESLNFDWEKSLQYFSTHRKKDTDAISDLAMNNFVEMRDHVTNERFIKEKALEARLQKAYPEVWMPLYSMVTFSDLPYSEALLRGQQQAEILRRLPEGFDPYRQPLEAVIKDFNDLVRGVQTN